MEKVMRALAVLVLAVVLSSCATRVPVTDLNNVDPTELKDALRIRTYVVGQTPKGEFSVIEPIDAYSCKHMTWDKPASKGDALQQLKYKAAKLGADAIMDVEFDTRGTDAWGTNCWQSVQASGIAIKMQPEQGTK